MSVSLPSLLRATVVTAVSCLGGPLTFDEDSDETLALVGDSGREAILAGVDWLVQHQSGAGYWTLDGEPGEPSVNTTSLATLALLRESHPPDAKERRERILLAANWLERTLTLTLDAREQASCLYALSELRNRFPAKFKVESVQARVDSLLALRNAEKCWSDDPEEPTRLLTTAWATGALVASRGAGCEINPADLQALEAWFDSIADDDGQVQSESTSGAVQHGPALCLLPRLMLNLGRPVSAKLQRQAALLVTPRARPDWEQEALEAWYASATALLLLKHEQAPDWYTEMRDMFLDNQMKGGSAAGCWNPVGYEPDRGRVRSTAIAVLSLEAPYRAKKLAALLAQEVGTASDKDR